MVTPVFVRPPSPPELREPQEPRDPRDPRHPLHPPHPPAATRGAQVPHRAHVASTRIGTAPGPACRWCGRPLSDLQRRRGEVCDAAPCRHRADEEAARRQRVAALDAVCAAAAARHGTAPAYAPVVWLRHFEAPIVALGTRARRRHAAHLAGLVAHPEDHGRQPLHAYPEDLGPAPPVDGALCTLCRGRCCQHGVKNHGFVDAELLRRHCARRGGTLADAAAQYLARLPARHVRGSCAYHGARGCVLPREERAPICNGFACDSLRAARSAVEGDAATPLLVAHVAHERLVRASWLPAVGAPAHRLPPPRSTGAPEPAVPRTMHTPTPVPSAMPSPVLPPVPSTVPSPMTSSMPSSNPAPPPPSAAQRQSPQPAPQRASGRTRRAAPPRAG